MSMGTSDSALLVPPSRLGRVLREQRHNLSLSIDEVSDASQVSPALLEDAEQGRAKLDEKLLETLAAAYDIDVQRLTPQRAELIIDLEEGWMSASEQQIAVGGADVLTRYLALLYTLREIPSGTAIPLRDLDVGVLAHALEADRTDIESELNGLMTKSPAQVDSVSSSLRNRIVVPLAGILVGITAIGGLVLVRAEPTVAVADEVPVDIGDAIMIANPTADQTQR